jgi:hypothetical protein
MISKKIRLIPDENTLLMMPSLAPFSSSKSFAGALPDRLLFVRLRAHIKNNVLKAFFVQQEISDSPSGRGFKPELVLR